jgi:hypothetical protein
MRARGRARSEIRRPAGPPPPRFADAPAPASERRAWLLAGAVGLLGLLALVAVLSGIVGQRSSLRPPPAVLRATPTPAAAATPAAGAGAGVPAGPGGVPAGAAQAHRPGRILARPTAAQQRADARRFAAAAAATETHIARRWMEGFYPIYATAQRTFGVTWLLLASIHMQETAFSTAPSTYHGLNFAHCCAGPMQFNLTNGPVSTWSRVSNSYIYGRRPALYGHMSARHPSIYDDFDAIMAAAHLLSADGAGYDLDASAWGAAYDYYGHDATGVTYADQVLARAIGWSQHGFCINCATDTGLTEAVHGAYGAAVLAALSAPPPSKDVARAAATSRQR